MTTAADEILSALQADAASRGRVPSRSEFIAASGISESRILGQCRSWNEAVRTAGLAPHEVNRPIDVDSLFEAWASFVRANRAIPTRMAFTREGKYSPGVYEKRIGSWSEVPAEFRKWAATRPDWADVLALLPPGLASSPRDAVSPTLDTESDAGTGSPILRGVPLPGRATYGSPIDFRGLPHAPVNESGVVFLFGTVAQELGFLVEALQAGYPDCKAKRQVGPGKWQRVRIEFEFESRNFRDHGHRPDGCDVIVC